MVKFGQTRGLAFGAYGEASPDVHALLTVGCMSGGEVDAANNSKHY